MPVYGILQLVAVSITAYLGLVLSRGSSDWLSVVFSVTFSHYLLALWYGRRRFAVIAQQPASIAAFGVLLLLGYGLYSKGFPLYAYFALHHAFNEAYLRNQRLPVDRNSTVLLRSSAIILHFLAVLLLIKNPIRLNYEPVLWVLLITSVIVWLRALAPLWSQLNNAQRLDQVMLELILLVLLPIAHFYPMTLVQVVCYHVVFWGFYPLLMLGGDAAVAAVVRLPVVDCAHDRRLSRDFPCRSFWLEGITFIILQPVHHLVVAAYYTGICDFFGASAVDYALVCASESESSIGLICVFCWRMDFFFSFPWQSTFLFSD